MYILNPCGTPKETLQSVLNFLQEEIDRYNRQASTHTLMKNKLDAKARANAISFAHSILSDTNVMRGD